jgi:hypothetical protein
VLLAWTWLVAACAPSPAPPGDEHPLFSSTQVARLDLELTDEARRRSDQDGKAWVPARLRVAGELVDVQVRRKGHRSLRSWRGKPALKIRLSRPVHGLAELVLNNLVEDPTLVREALAYRLHREAGVAAPRTGFVDLRVNGRPYGLYLHVEAPDEQLLARHYDDASGGLFEGEYGCDLYPDDVEGFEKDAGEEGRGPLRALVEVAHRDPDLLVGEAGPLDRPRVLAYLAVSAVIGDFDGYRHAHNYRLYHDPSTDRWSLLPWGLDRTFRKRLALTDSGGLLARRCFADAGCRLAYLRQAEQVAARLEALVQAGEVERLFALADRVAKPGAERRRRRAQLLAFLRNRPAEVRAQLGCLGPEGEVDADGDGWGCLDCDDRDPTVHPGARELCDGVDDDCSDAVTCGCEELEVAGTRFQLCELPMGHADAEAFCRGLGRRLARVVDKRTARGLGRALGERGKQRWWIGLSDRQVEGEFVWADGEAVDEERWGRGQPDDAACGEDCVALRSDGKWSDAHCELRRPFVCE